MFGTWGSIFSKYRILRSIFVVSIFLFPSLVSAQYCIQLIPPIPRVYTAFLTPYFLNAEYGFIFFSDVGSPDVVPGLSRTIDSGKSFQKISYFDTLNLTIRQLCFASPARGYVVAVTRTGALRESPSGGGVYETLDSGTTWRLVSNNVPYGNVYAVGMHVFVTKGVFDIHKGSPLFYSTNGGNSWDSITGFTSEFPNATWQFRRVYGNLDSVLLCSCAVRDIRGTFHDYLAFSTDLGHSWQSHSIGTAGVLHISPHSCQIVRQCFDGDGNGDTYSFLLSSPPYEVWDTVLDNHETGAWTAGNSCAMYIPVAADDWSDPDSRLELWRSSDAGGTWEGIPSDRFFGGRAPYQEIDDGDWPVLSVVGYGATVYCGSWTGSLFKIRDGGDGSLHTADFAPRIDFDRIQFSKNSDTIQMSRCEKQTVGVYYINTRCAITEMDSVWLEGMDPSEYTASVIHRTCGMVGDTIHFELHPNSIGSRNITIHAHFTDDEYATIDTTTRFVLKVVPSQSVSLHGFLQPGSFTAKSGDTIDIPIYLSSDPQTVTLDGQTTVVLPFGLDSNSVQVIGFFPTLPGVSIKTETYDNGVYTVSLVSSDLRVSQSSIVGTLRFVVYLSDSLRTTVRLQEGNLISEDSRCLNYTTSSDAVTVAFTDCGDSLVLDALRHEAPFSISQIVPNPAANEIRVSFMKRREASSIAYELFDIEGHRALSGDNFEGVLNIRSLAPGLYFLRLSQNGFVETRSLTISR